MGLGMKMGVGTNASEYSLRCRTFTRRATRLRLARGLFTATELTRDLIETNKYVRDLIETNKYVAHI